MQFGVTWLATSLIVASCSAWAASPTPVKQAPAASPVAYDGAQGPRSVVYRRTLMTVSDEKFGTISRGYFCTSPRPLTLNQTVVNAIGTRFAGAARRELRLLGYVDAAEEQSAFARNAGAVGDFELAGSVRDIEAHFCIDTPRESVGGTWLQIRWELFSAKQQQVVHTVTSEGSYSIEKWTETTIEDIFERAFVAALKNALAEPTMQQHLLADPKATAALVAKATKALPRVAADVNPPLFAGEAAVLQAGVDLRGDARSTQWDQGLHAGPGGCGWV